MRKKNIILKTAAIVTAGKLAVAGSVYGSGKDDEQPTYDIHLIERSKPVDVIVPPANGFWDGEEVSDTEDYIGTIFADDELGEVRVDFTVDGIPNDKYVTVAIAASSALVEESGVLVEEGANKLLLDLASADPLVYAYADPISVITSDEGFFGNISQHAKFSDTRSMTFSLIVNDLKVFSEEDEMIYFQAVVYVFDSDSDRLNADINNIAYVSEVDAYKVLATPRSYSYGGK
jgi:hypothetical protein